MRNTRARGGDTDASVVVLGLGRFGRALALQLVEDGHEVLGIDADEETVQSLHGVLTHVVKADTTNEDALRQLAVGDFDRAVVGIGSHVEASILTASTLLSFEIGTIWAKAISEPHARILTQLGVHHVVRPETEMGRKVAHLVGGAMRDFIEVGPDFAMVTIAAPPQLVGQRLGDTGLRQQHEVTVVAVCSPGGAWTHATADTVLGPEHTVIVAGPVRAAERFARAVRR